MDRKKWVRPRHRGRALPSMGNTRSRSVQCLLATQSGGRIDASKIIGQASGVLFPFATGHYSRFYADFDGEIKYNIKPIR